MQTRGTDPVHAGATGRKRDVRNAAHAAASVVWERDGDHKGGGGTTPLDPDSYAREVLPGLRCVPLRAMAKSTGLTEGYCSLV